MTTRYQPYKVINSKKTNNFIILCDHASYNIPKKYNKLGLSDHNLKKHIGWDIGALKVAKKISKNTNSTLIHSGYSRLLVDCNRSLKSKGAFLTKSEDIIRIEELRFFGIFPIKFLKIRTKDSKLTLYE